VDHFALVMGAELNHIIRTAFTYETGVDEYIQGIWWLLTR
jgi:hypothetical protein